MGSDLWLAELDAYIDSELSPERAAELEAHLKECPDCALAALEKMRLKRAVHLAGARYQPDAAFRARVRAQIVPPATSRRWSWAVALTLAAGLLLAVGIGTREWVNRSLRERLLADVVDRHVVTLASANMVDVVSSDRHTVKPWFQGKLPFTFNLPELAGSQFVLVGGRIAYLSQAPGAELIYDIRKHHISVFIFQEQGDFSRLLAQREKASTRSSFALETWAANGLRYFVVGDAAQADISNLAGLFRTAAR